MSFVYLETQFLRGAFALCMCRSSRVDLPHGESSAGRLVKCFFSLFVFLTFVAVLTTEFLWKCTWCCVVGARNLLPALSLWSETFPNPFSPYINMFLILLLSLFLFLFVFILFCPVPFTPPPILRLYFSYFLFPLTLTLYFVFPFCHSS
jgi:hypothetical protein